MRSCSDESKCGTRCAGSSRSGAVVTTEKLASRVKPSDYMQGSDAVFEEIGRVEAVPDRLIMYHGNLLHSGVIPHGMSFSADPRQGRLTANIFIIGRIST